MAAPGRGDPSLQAAYAAAPHPRHSSAAPKYACPSRGPGRSFWIGGLRRGAARPVGAGGVNQAPRQSGEGALGRALTPYRVLSC